MQRFTNTGDVPLAVGVFLASDNYDYNSDPWTISATTLMKPLRQIILSKRIPPTDSARPLVDMVKNRIGAAIHDAIERAWLTNKDNALAALGYPKRVQDMVVINPTKEQVAAGNIIPVYMEQRLSKQVGKWTVTGKFDFVGEGKVQDFKSTSTFTYTNQLNAKKFQLQGSIYRWLDPEMITQGIMEIHHIFTDWSLNRSRNSKDYPNSPVLTQQFELLSIGDIDAYIKRKLQLIEQYMDAPEEEIPHCDDEELWRSSPVWKYYSSPDSVRSSKNFDNAAEAHLHRDTKGKGLIKEVRGSVTACKYCSAFSVCGQKDALIAAGDLTL